MGEYILRHKREEVNDLLKELVKTVTYSCKDPRLHERSKAEAEKRTTAARAKLSDELRHVAKIIDEYSQDQKMAYCLMNMVLAGAFLGAGSLLERDTDFPGRASKSLSVAFWNLGNWRRKNSEKFPLPTQLQRYKDNTDCDVDENHDPAGDRAQYNNFCYGQELGSSFVSQL